MIEQEAIDLLDNIVIDPKLGLESLAKTLEFVNVSVAALKKQIPKKVIFVHPLQEDDGGDYACPSCKSGTVYDAYGKEPPFCHYCGQAIKWK